MDTASLVWREQIELPYGNIFTLQDKVTQKITQKLRHNFGVNAPQIVQSKVSINPIAYEYYLRSLSYPLTKTDDLLAVAMLQNSIELEGGYEKYHVEIGFSFTAACYFWA